MLPAKAKPRRKLVKNIIQILIWSVTVNNTIARNEQTYIINVVALFIK